MGQQHATPARDPVVIPPAPQVSPHPNLSSVSLVRESTPTEDIESVPVMFKWTHGGQRVYLTGTFNGWAKEGIPMVRSGQEFYQILEISKGVHEYKFLVDGEWKFSLDQPVLQDIGGNVNNVVDIQYYEKYEPAPLQDPLEVEDEEEFSCETVEPIQTEPPSAPPLLIRLPLLGIPSYRKSESSKIVSSGLPQQQVNIPLFSIAGHITHDASVSFRGVSSDSLLCSSTIRFAQKFSTSVLVTLNNSARSDGLLRHYGIPPQIGRNHHMLLRALKGQQQVEEPTGLDGRTKSKTLDISTFTD